MGIVKSDYMTGLKFPPTPCEAGELYEVTVKINTAVTNLGATDLVQIMQLPASAVVTDIRIGASATLGATTVAAGIATDATTATLATTYIAAGTITTTAVVNANATIMGDVALDAPTSDQRIVAILLGAEAEATNIIYVSVRYRAKD